MEYEELLENYFREDLTVEERQLFRDLLENDQAFQEEFAFQSNLKKAITKTKRDDRKAILQEIENNIGESRSAHFKINWGRLSIAATILLLIGFGWYSGFFSGPDMQGMYVANYQVYPNTEYTIDRNTEENTLERRAFVAYETKDYVEAIPLFLELIGQGVPNIDFYLGQSYLGNDQAREAIPVFKKVINEDDAYAEESKWYLALAFLRIEEKKNAIEQLREIKTGYK
ncbi:MAG: tetratricopeptide repeat protein, partial [Cyclobacteriaceae bacterium]